jgi:hypothetical protein
MFASEDSDGTRFPARENEREFPHEFHGQEGASHFGCGFRGGKSAG